MDGYDTARPSPTELSGQQQTLRCDASDKGDGTALFSSGTELCMQAQCVFEQGYARMENELLAAVCGVVWFYQYTYDGPVIALADHKPLEMLMTNHFRVLQKDYSTC